MSVPSILTAHAPRRFLAILAVLVALGLGATLIVNVVIDPFDVLRLVTTPWLPHRPAQEGKDRIHKVALVRRERPDALLLGTSRAMVMLDPRSPAFRGHAEHVVNAAVNGAQPYDQLRMFQHAHALRAQRLLVLGLDLLSFDAGAKLPPAFDEQRFAVAKDGRPQPFARFSDFPAVALSEDALRASLSTLRRRGDPSYVLPLGQRDPAFQERQRERAGGALEYFRASEGDYLDGYACAHPFEVRGEPVSTTAPLEDLRALLAVARAAGTKVRLYFSPVHGRHLAVIRAAGLWDAHARWRDAVAALVAEARAAGLDVQLFDFLALPGVLDEAPGGPLWWESSHASSALGEQLLPVLLDDARPSPSLTSVDAAYGEWAAGHVADVQEIEARAAEVLPSARAACRR